MNRRRILTIVVSAGGTIAALGGLSVLFELTSLPRQHYEFGWVVTGIGCALMAWQLRSNVVVTLLACVAFLVAVRYVALAIAYSVLESGGVWRF
jgi:hypothetical protein